MKKIIITLLLLIFTTPCFAEYKAIPKELSKQYKKEVEQINIEINKLDLP